MIKKSPKNGWKNKTLNDF